MPQLAAATEVMTLQRLGARSCPHLLQAKRFRFNDFEFDVAAYQVRRQGRVVR